MPFLNAPVVAKSFDGRFELFIPWTDGIIYHKWQTIASSATNPAGEWIPNWFPHGKKGTGFTGPLTLISNEDGRLELFAKTNENEIYHKWQSAKSAGWTDWVVLAQGKAFTVVENANKELEIIFVTSQDTLAYKRQQSPNGVWGNVLGIPPLAGSPRVKYFGTPAVALNSSGRLEVFVSGQPEGGSFSNRRIYRASASKLEEFVFNDSSGLAASNPVLGQSADKRLELFAIGDNGVLHAWETSTPGNWSNWFLHGKPGQGQAVHNPAPLAAHAQGRLALRVVSVSEDPIASEVFGKKQMFASGPWTNWFVDSPQGIFSDPAMVRSVDDRLYLFVVGYPSLRVFYKWEKAPNGDWSVAPDSLNWPLLGRP